MKRLITVISAMAVSMLFSATAIFAADNSPMSFGKYGSQQSSRSKNECLLVAKNSGFSGMAGFNSIGKHGILHNVV